MENLKVSQQTTYKVHIFSSASNTTNDGIYI